MNINEKKLGGKVFLIVADEGRGKTTLVKSMLRRISATHKLMIYDVQKEYTEFTGVQKLPSMKEFVDNTCALDDLGYCKVKDACIVFEEATLFFDDYHRANAIMPLLIGKRHNRNIIFFIFHTLDGIPRNLLRRINFLILFKTSDLEGNILAKYKTDPEIIDLFNDVKLKSASKFHYCNVLERNNS